MKSFYLNCRVRPLTGSRSQKAEPAVDQGVGFVPITLRGIHKVVKAWLKRFRIIPEFRILRPTALKMLSAYYVCCIKYNDVARTPKKATHIKGRQLYQAVIVFNCLPFHNGNFS